MSREVRRVPMGWQHPMEWRDQWDWHRKCVREQLLPRPLWPDFPGSLAGWETDGEAIKNREGWDWNFELQYTLTGYRGESDTQPAVHPFDTYDDEEIMVRDEDHLQELLLAKHAAERPDPADYMPVFDVPDDRLGWCMYETTSKGTPISPVMASPEELAHWLADNRANTFANFTATYEQWLAVCRDGWAPSMVASRGHLMSGVEFVAETEARP